MKKIALFLLLTFFAQTSFALETKWQSTKNNEGSINLISGGYNNEGQIISGIHIKLSDTWKTYWKNPGDSGMAITPSFYGSQNIVSSEMLWPVPERHLFYDLEGWGYENEIILPVISGVKDPSKPAKLNVNVKWAVCDENCIFVDNKLTLQIPAGYKDEVAANLIETYQKQVPHSITDSSEIKLASLVVNDKSILVEFSSSQKFSDKLDLFITDESKNFRYPKPEITVSPDSNKISVKTNYEVLKKGSVLENKTLELTIKNGSEGYQTEYKIEKVISGEEVNSISNDQSVSTNPALKPLPIEKPVISPKPAISLLEAIIAAILGGLILNIMPCVLPVLSIKIFGAIKHGASDKKYIRKSFSYTIAGIIFSFLALAAFVVTLKILGHGVGWGIQFQHPAFLVFLAILLTLFAANQWGIFEILLPQKLSDKINIKIDEAGDATPLGNFLTGAFATILATPCTAPYLATAVTFAFTSDFFTIFLIFFFMGVGLSIPYIMVLISPSLVRILPRPGRWMKIVKFILGLLLFITNFWIVIILFNNGGPNAGFMMMVCLILMTLWLFVSTKMKLDKTKTLLTTIYMIVVTFGMTLYLANIEKEPEFMKGRWIKFEESHIQKYVDENKVVFVDVTADWCLTCKFNKAYVLYPMKAYLDEEGIILMKADYTSPDKVISAYLEKKESYGIPLNIVYGPHAPEGIRLPVVLKTQDIKNAINKAK